MEKGAEFVLLLFCKIKTSTNLTQCSYLNI